MYLAGLLELLVGFTKVAGGLSKLSKESRDKVKSFLLEASKCLKSIARKRKRNRSTPYECGQLAIYIRSLPIEVKLALGKKKTEELIQELNTIYDYPGPSRHRLELSYVYDDIKIDESRIMELAGELKALVDTL